jgi:hypothetical protein
MKTLIIITSLLLLITSCDTSNKGKLSNVKLEEAIKLCQENEGIEKVHLKEESYKVYCGNGAHSLKLMVGKDYVATDTSAMVDNNEITSCVELCSKNGGVKFVHAERDCTKWVSSGRTSNCEERSDLVTCECYNSISRTTKRPIWSRF